MKSKPRKIKFVLPSLWASVFLFSVLFSAPGSSFAVVGKPTVVYSEEGRTAVEYSTYSSGAWATGAPAADVSSSNEKYWKVAKTHPGGAKKATLFVQNAASSPHLFAALWDESRWDDGTGSAYGDAKDLGAISTKDYRCFDAAYEPLTGRLMVVAATASNTITYWTWDAGTWSSGSTYTFTDTMATIHWVKIAAKPASNEITLIAADSGKKANAVIWSGSAWGNEVTLTASGLTTNTTEVIGVEYIRAGSEMGHSVVFWAANYLYGQRWTGSAWQSSTYRTGSLLRWLRVKADPNSNKIAVGYEDSNERIYVQMWEGTAFWANLTEMTTTAYGDADTHRPFDVIFETGYSGGKCFDDNTTYKCMGNLLAVYADRSSSSNPIRSKICSLNGLTSMTCSADFVDDASSDAFAYWVQLERAQDETIHLAVHDVNEDLITWTWRHTTPTEPWIKQVISTELERDTNHNHEVFALFPNPEARAILVWSSNTSAKVLEYGRYHDGAFSSKTVIQSSLSYEQFWKVVKTSADGSKQVVLSADYRTTSLPHLLGSIYDGSSWTSLRDFGTIWSTKPSSNYIVRHRDFDAAFETSDGNIVVVATHPTSPHQCNYWTHDGSSWSSPSSLTFTDIPSGYSIKWVKLASNPNADSNEIALIVGADSGTTKRAVAMIWGGSSWGNEQILTSALSATDQEAIAVEYMQAGSNRGKALFAWAESSAIDGQVWNGSGYEDAQIRSVTVTNPIKWLHLSADPASDDLMLAYEDAGKYVYAFKWTGDAWDTSGTAINSTSLYYNGDYGRAFDVIWESGYGHTGHAIIAYSDNSTSSFSYRHYDGSSWGPESAVLQTSAFYWMELARTTDNTIHLAAHAQFNSFYNLIWDDASWSIKHYASGVRLDNNDKALEEGAATSISRPQVFSITPVATTKPQIQAVDHNFGCKDVTISIYGVGFGNAQGDRTVTFHNDQTTTVTSWSDVKIVVTVPSGAESGYITVTRGGASDTIAFTITGTPTVTGILPAAGSNFSNIDIAYITGTNFSPEATVKLKRSGEPDITATNVTVLSPTLIAAATFDTTSAAVGLWNVEVTNLDGKSGTGNNLYEIHPPGPVAAADYVNQDSLAYPNGRHLVRDSAGNWYAVFYSGNTSKIFMTRSTDGGKTWDFPTTLVGASGIIDTNDPSSKGLSVDVYRTGTVGTDRIHLVWTRVDGTAKYLYYSKCNDLGNYSQAASWSNAGGGTSPRYDELDAVDGASYYIEHPDVAVDKLGKPHVVWHQKVTSAGIKYGTEDPLAPGSWVSYLAVSDSNEAPYAEMNEGCSFPSIDTDSNGYPHIAYAQVLSTSGKYIIRHAWSTNRFFSQIYKNDIIVDSSKDFQKSSLVIDSNDKIYVVTSDETDRDLFWAYGYYSVSEWTWSTSNNLTNGSLAVESAVVGVTVDSETAPYVLLAKPYDASSMEKVVYWFWDSTNSNWSKHAEALDTGNETLHYVSIEKHAPESESLHYLFYDSSGDELYIDTPVRSGSPPTAVSLLALKATGDGDRVVVSWATAQEINNFGFHVYRSESAGGPYARITDSLIPGLTFSVRGRDDSYVDRNVTRGRLYYYKLEDIDLDGQRTMHGPVCVDWDGDGIPEDWEIKYGLNPAVDDAGVDPDGDGLTNLEEYARNTNPFGPDSDGDGTRDSEEQYVGTVSEALMRGVEVIASDATGMTLELRTDSFESVAVDVGGVCYDRLRVPEYVHGCTDAVGKPELPVKGIFVDLPGGKGGTLSIESVESWEWSDYRAYPVPEKVASRETALETVTEVFAIDEAAYRLNRFYPDVVARAGETYDYRGQKKLQVFFNPFSFNPVTGKLIQYTRIRVRVAYVALAEAVPVVRSGVPLSAPVSSLAGALAWAPPEPASAYKMAVSEEGIYRLTGAYLASQGVSVSDWSQVRVYHSGQEIPVYEGGDYIEFYGTPPGEAYSKYTKHNVYWLTTFGGSGTPLRMGTIDGTPGTASIPSTHVYTVHTEKDQEYVGEAPGPESLDRWVFGAFAYGSGVAGAGPVHYPITLPGVGGTQVGQVSVLLCGLSTLGHDVEIFFNGVSLGTYQWSGFEFYEVSFSDVPLLDGLNTLTLTCLSGSDPVEPDGVALDWVEVAYPRKYEASGNGLKLTHDAGYKYQVGNFTNSTIQAYDITTPTDVKRVTNVQVSGTNPYTLTMEPRSGSGERTYLVLSSGATRTPVSITKDVAGALSGTWNGADYLLITHRNLGWDGTGTPRSWLSNLKAHREAEGLRVKVVDVEDIYDEFSYGILSPQGIKDFLSYTYGNWTSPAPQYVLLAGDSAYDPKDNYGLGTINYVPTYLARTPFMGESLTDEWFARISRNDAIADMDIGRLPAATTAQAEIMVDKIISYETTPVSETWERNTLLVADNRVKGYEVLFELMNEDAAGLLPAGMNAPFREYLNHYVLPNDLTVSMRNRLNVDGALIWNYSGHASVQVWANENIFSVGQVAALSNSGKLPFVVAMTCLNGFFGYPEGWNYPSLAEALLRNSSNGAVAAFMSTGMTEPEGQRVLDQALFEGIFKRDYRRLGRAIAYAKQELVANSVALGEVGKTFLLFGDPAMKLKVPLPTAPTSPGGQVSGQSVTLSWGASVDAYGAPVAGYDVYRSTTPNGPYTKVNSSLVTNNEYTDNSVQVGTYYYVVNSVDGDGDESAGTLEMTATIGARSVGGSESGGGGGGGGGCFISTMSK